MEASRQEWFEKFMTSRQEPLRLSIALEEFTRPDVPEDRRETYGQYLRRRIRPAVMELVRADDARSLRVLAGQGWLDAKTVEDAVALAAREKKTAALVWLLLYKQDAFGFCDRDFSL